MKALRQTLAKTSLKSGSHGGRGWGEEGGVEDKSILVCQKRNRREWFLCHTPLVFLAEDL
jgi:hypothetical protein